MRGSLRHLCLACAGKAQRQHVNHRVLLGVLHGVSQEELPIHTTRQDAEKAAVRQLAANEKLQLSLLNCATEVVAFSCNPGTGELR
jgi:hypothetical protein